MKIGVFDSGLGGLTILNAIREHLPEYDYVYYGDTKNIPYGDKSEEEVRTLTRNAVMHLLKRDVALVIVACNTASAETLRVLQDTVLVDEYTHRRILGVIIPTIEAVLEGEHTKVLLIGTTRTITSNKYERELAKRGNDQVELVSISTPTLVPLIESGDISGACHTLDTYLTPRVGEIDTLVLGCTHYTVLKDHIRKTHPELMVISQDEIIPEKLKQYLCAHPEIEKHLSRTNSTELIITGEEPGYSRMARE